MGLAMGIEEKLPSGVLLTSVEKLAGWARARSVWPATFGLACCAIELFQTGGPQHDLARVGVQRPANTPPPADLVILAGRGPPPPAPAPPPTPPPPHPPPPPPHPPHLSPHPPP